MDETPREAPETKKPRSCVRSCLLFGCLPLLGIALGLGLYLWFSARSSLRERTGALVAEIDAFEARPPSPRPVLLGDPIPGNAADDYWLITYVLGPPSTWKRGTRVTLAPTSYACDHAALNKVDTAAAGKELQRRIFAGDRSPLTGEAARFAKLYAPLADQLRSALRKRRCDWGSQLDRGLGSDLFNLLETRNMAALLAHQASLAEGEAAAERSLEVVLFARDLARFPSLYAITLGAKVEEIGLEVVRASLKRLPPSGLRRVIAVLGRLEPVDVRRTLECDRLALLVHLSAKGGTPVSPQAESSGFMRLASGMEIKRPGRVETWLGNRVLLDREWRLYEGYYREALEALDQPASQRGRVAAELRDRINSSLSVLGRFALPNIRRLGELLEESEARYQATRMLAAAQLHRLETGAFPKSGAALAPYLGGALPLDPFKDREKPLAYSLVQGAATVSWAKGSAASAAPQQTETK